MSIETEALTELAQLKTQPFTDLHERLQAEINIEARYGREVCRDAKRKVEDYRNLAHILLAQGDSAQRVRDELVAMLGIPQAAAQAIIEGAG